jgi:hypothetical protein
MQATLKKLFIIGKAYKGKLVAKQAKLVLKIAG